MGGLQEQGGKMNVQLTLALRYLSGRKLRTALTTLAVVFGVAILFGMNSLLPAMVQMMRQGMLATAGQADLTVTSVGEAPFSSSKLDELRGVAGIAVLDGSLQRMVLLPAALVPAQPAPVGISKPGMAPAQSVNSVLAVGLDLKTAQTIRTYPLVEGRFLEAGDTTAVAMPESLATKLKLKVGDTFTLPAAVGTTSFTLVGMLASRPGLGAEPIYMPLATAQTLLDYPGQINRIEGVFESGAEAEQVNAAVQAVLGAGFELGQQETDSELYASIQMGEFAFAIFGLMSLAMGAFIIFNTFRTIVAERRRDLGMLRAVGASRATLVGLILFEGLLQGLMGTILGLMVGYLMALGIIGLIQPVIVSLLHMELGMPVITVSNLLISTLLGLGVTIVGGLLPSLSAARIAPLEALRPQPAAVYERTARRSSLAGAVLIVLAALALLSGMTALAGVGTLLFLVGLVLVGPALVQPLSRIFGRLLVLIFAREGRIAEVNLARQPGRAAVTASAMMLGLATVIALLGMVTSISEGFMRYLDRSLGADLLVIPTSFLLGGGNVGAAPELAQAMRETPGVSTVTTLRLGYAEVNGGTLQVVGIDPTTYPEIAGLEFTAGESQDAYAALGQERALIINGIFASQSKAKIGDWLTLQTPEGPKDYRVVGVGLDYLNAKLATAYISQPNLEQDFHQNGDLLLMADMVAGTDVVALRRSMVELVNQYPAFTLIEWQTFRKNQEAAFSSAMSMLYLMTLMFALPALIAMINTLAINVLERTREIGVLRAVGSTRSQIQRMIRAESLLLSGVGISFGILAGLWLGYVLVLAINAVGFSVYYYFPFAGVLAALAVGILFGVIAASIPARQAARMDIVAALHYE